MDHPSMFALKTEAQTQSLSLTIWFDRSPLYWGCHPVPKQHGLKLTAAFWTFPCNESAIDLELQAHIWLDLGPPGQESNHNIHSTLSGMTPQEIPEGTAHISARHCFATSTHRKTKVNKIKDPKLSIFCLLNMSTKAHSYSRLIAT